KAMEVANRLGASGYVFWGGREGYETLLNTNLGLEMDNEARFLEMAVEHADRIGFDGQLLIEPKPKEPTKHQYDFDVEHAHAFLQKYGLEDYFKANIEANHATLAGHSFQHELNYARQSGLLGSVDANQGDKLLGWDTDQFPTDVYSTTLAMYEILQAGGLKPGGLNFDAKVRRPSFEPVDLFYGHIAGMDAFARGLEVAQRLLDDGVFQEYLADRYNSYSNGIGKRIAGGEVGFSELDEYVRGQGEITIESGRQEKLESILNRYILET
ncbi:MAG: xylose isomerase, partial [Candidatus Bipolaricaulota bacterium]